jgi:hypothetical protein
MQRDVHMDIVRREDVQKHGVTLIHIYLMSTVRASLYSHKLYSVLLKMLNSVYYTLVYTWIFLQQSINFILLRILSVM